MTHEETNLQTKKALAASLKKMMAQKPLKKITVSEIIADCNVNRKTFYYHFEDIYALLRWILEQEAVEVVRQFDLMADLEDALTFALDYVEANAHLLSCAYDSIGREEMKRFFCSDFEAIMRSLIDGAEQERHLCVSADFKAFLCHFYTAALADTLVSRFQQGSHTAADRQATIRYLVFMLRYTMPDVLEKAALLPRIDAH